MSTGGARDAAAGRPLLGVAGRWGDAEIELARRFDDLHQLIYRRGGIRPSNAAVEEVAKLVLIRLWSLRHGRNLFPDAPPERFRAAFASVLAAPDFAAAGATGAPEPVWPAGEPFRLEEPTVLAAAAGLVAEIVDHGLPSVSDPLGAAFDALLAGRYDHAGGLGTYLTPSGVARMMAEIAADLVQRGRSDGPGFADPYCGTGRFLVAMLEVLRERDAAGLLRAGPFGADQSASSVAKARINMLLYGVARPPIWTVTDSVTDSDVDRYAGQIPIVLTNPPFGEGKYASPVGIARTAHGLPRLTGKRSIDPCLAGLVRGLRLLTPGGVLGIVLPDGVVESRAFADLTTGRAGDDLRAVGLAATVSLPTATFALSGTVAKTSAVFLARARRRYVALARVNHVGYLRKAGRAAPDPAGNELPAIAGHVRDGLTHAGHATLTVQSTSPLVAIAAAGSIQSLDPARLDPATVEARRDLAERGGIELRELLAVKRAPHARRTPFVSVLHVDDLGTVDWRAASSHTPATAGLLAEEGDLIVSLLNPSRLRAAVIPPGVRPVAVSAEFGVFAASCDPYAVLGLLHAPRVRAQLSPLGRGTSSSRRRIDSEDVLSLVVPKLDAASLTELGRTVRAGVALVDDGRRRLQRAFEAVEPR